MSVAVWNILDIDEEAGEEGVNALISDFTTKRMNEEGIPEALNPDIEEFLKHNALQFAREKKSITYLVCDEDGGNRISGSELMRFCNKELFELQHRLGGGLVYLDCEAHAGLIDFYEKKQNFRLFGERISDNDRKRYLQYMKFL